MAIDARPEQIRATQKSCAGLLNIIFRVADVEKSEFAIAEAVFHVGLLYHLLDPVAHLKKLCGVESVQAIFLDTHFAPAEQCERTYQSSTGALVQCSERAELVVMPRSGVNATSRWLSIDTIMSLLGETFKGVFILERRIERNGPRATIMAKERR